jgi:hypothetical protein
MIFGMASLQEQTQVMQFQIAVIINELRKKPDPPIYKLVVNF